MQIERDEKRIQKIRLKNLKERNNFENLGWEYDHTEVDCGLNLIKNGTNSWVI
jgi:hypothetical protein